MARTKGAGVTTGSATRWVCTVCGYIHEGDEPPEMCPVCGVGADMFEKLDI